MADITVEADAFGRTLEQLLGRVDESVKSKITPAVERSLETGQRAWKKNARAVLSASYSRGGWGKARKGAVRFKSGAHKGQVKGHIKAGWYGRTYKTGKYASSISHHMLQGGDTPEGEIGSPTVPGLVHLLEKGHASVGGGFVGGREHVAPASEEAFKEFEQEVDKGVEAALREA